MGNQADKKIAKLLVQHIANTGDTEGMVPNLGHLAWLRFGAEAS